RCIDASASLFCRVTPRVSACCGDKLCEGAETVSSCFIDCDPVAGACTPTELNIEYSCSDGKDNDCDQLFDDDDPDCVDTDGDGLTDAYENNITGTDHESVDTDLDGLVDGNSGVVRVVDYPDDPGYPDAVDADGDGSVDGEQTTGTDANNEDTDGDLINDGLEVANGSDPLDPLDLPNLADGDVAPYGAPNGQLNAGDLTVMMRLALGLEDTRALELAHGDLGTPDGVINAADVILLIQMLHSQ
ncbi:MAG: hypothetical protein OEU62_05695, partial [Gammaproteobacteria bacterium]|nr:hypothetical protein [Gammaproteobacteria bacterium]